MAIDYQIENGIATITIDRPDRRNALLSDQVDELAEYLRRGDDEARVLIVTGADPAFCAGVDLKDSSLSQDLSLDELDDRLSRFQSLPRTMRRISTPVISRVNGPAMGAGSDLALAADFCVAADSAVFCESFVNVGVVSGDGGSYLLPRLVGERRAKEMLLLGKEISGKEAADIGLVNEVVPDEELDDAVDRYADRLLELPPTAVGRSKRLVNDSFEQSIEQAFTDALYAFWVCLQSEDFAEARAAFAESRDPNFSR